MKKNYLFTLILTLCFSLLSLAQGAEPFTNLAATSSYADGSFVGEGGITWTYIASRDGNNTAGVTLPALMLRRSSNESKITSSTIPGGIGEFSVKLYKGFSGAGNRQVELFINGVSKGVSDAFDDYDEHIFSITGLNISGDVIIELRNVTSKQIIIDDITWTAPSSDPFLSIASPTNNQVFSGSTTEVTVNFNYSNFTLSGDNGSEMTDSTGDGYILGSIIKDGVADGTQNIFSNSSLIESVTPGSTYILTAELVDNSGVSLSPKVEATATFSIELPCDLVLDDITTTCDVLTAGTDTYNGSIAFTGGNTGATYTITAPVGVTVGGDDPSSSASGTITFTGMTEGTDTDVNIVGGSRSSCDFSETLTSPTCIPFPVYESFDYTAGSDLMASTLWENNSNSSDEIQVVTGTLANPFSAGQYPDPVGNMISFDGAGSDSYIEFNDTNSGKLYTSFIFNVTDISAQKESGGYFAILSEATGTFKGRIWLKPDTTDDTKFNIGLSTSVNGSATYHTTAHATDVEVFVVMSFDFTTNEFKTWVDPDPATFEATEPAADITLGDTLSNLGRFGLRQDSGNETPPINFDELRIDTSWAGVTPKTATASTRDNSIEGFSIYPNPVNNNTFTITSNSISKKAFALFNVLGKKVFSSSFYGTKSDVDVSAISSGMYILKVTEDGKTATKKLVIK